MFPVCGDAQSSLNYGDREQNHPGANAAAAAAPPVMKPSKKQPAKYKNRCRQTWGRSLSSKQPQNPGNSRLNEVVTGIGKREQRATDSESGRGSAINLITVSGGGRSGAVAAAGTRSGGAERRRSINRIRAGGRTNRQEREEEDIRWTGTRSSSSENPESLPTSSSSRIRLR